MKGVCAPDMAFAECELEILRHAVDVADKRLAVEKVRAPNLKEIISIVEVFLKNKKLICYGGTAINNILPKKDQFYNYDQEIPDYDFFSPNAMDDAKELADIYFKKGFVEVSASAAVHFGTYKVFVDFIPVADITQISRPIFAELKRDAVKVNNISYCPPDFLRMLMYLELSRPKGDVSRWEKVLKRLTLLNKNYPLDPKKCNVDNFQRVFEGKNDYTQIYNIVKDTIIDHKYIFFGGHASYLFSRYMDEKIRKGFTKQPDFDVLAENPEEAASQIKSRLVNDGIKGVTIRKHDEIGDHSITLVPEHHEVLVGKDSVAMIYKPMHCHSFNKIRISNKEVYVATIDTMLSFYLAFTYANKPYYDADRILCMSKYLFDVQQKNRLEQQGLLKRFSIECYGKPSTLDDIRIMKAEKFKELKNEQGTYEYESWFLKYRPEENVNKRKPNMKKTRRERSNSSKTYKLRKPVSNLFNVRF